MSSEGQLIVISAPSGTGKSTLINRAVEELPNIWHSVSATTRKPRDYETEGVHYFFLDSSAFQDTIKNDGFLEWAQVHGEYYGTPCEGVDRHLKAGEDVIMDLDVQGALQVKQRRPETHLIFIMPPSLEAIRERLIARESDPEDVINMRLSIAEEEIAHKHRYDHVIVNDVLENAFQELMAIIQNIRERTEGASS
jgi:guanylate kinase